MRVHHLALRTRDVARLEAFYAGVLSLSVRRRDEAKGSVWLEAEGVIVMIEPAVAEEPDVPPGSMELVAFAAEAEAMPRWRETLASRGVAVVGETAYTIYFRDPDGRRVALSCYRAPGG